MAINTKSRKHRGKLNSKLALAKARVKLARYYSFGSGNDIIPFGYDNLYPNRIIDAIRESPTAKGCTKRFHEFVFGQGVSLGGDEIVNRSGETLNDILSQCVRDYSRLNGFCLHFNFNALGQIIEVFNVQMMYVRKHRTLDKVDVGVWDMQSEGYLGQEFITLDLYGVYDPVARMVEQGWQNYKGQLMYFSHNSDIYPDATLDGSTLSAEYERESQLYPYSNIRNSFSANKIVKLPTLTAGEKSQNQVDSLQSDLATLHGAENAGGSVVVPVMVGDDGKPVDFKMVEDLSPTNVDSLFVNQNASAERALLKTYTMPEILLGVSSQGMFNQAAFNDAFNYKNADTEMDRKIVEREFNKWLFNSVFYTDKVEIVPLEMKQTQDVTTTLQPNESSVEVETVNQGNEVLRGLSGKQVRQLLNEVNKYKNGKITRSQADVLLKAYGLSDEDIENMLSDD